MKRISRDRITAIVLFAVGILYLTMTLMIKRDMSSNGDPGAKIFPMIASVGLIICSIFIFLQGKDDAQPFLTELGWRKVTIVIGMLAVYVAGLKYIGFLLSTPFILLGTISMFVEDKKVTWIKRILFSLAATIIIYVVFVKLLNTILPRGIFYF